MCRNLCVFKCTVTSFSKRLILLKQKVVAGYYIKLCNQGPDSISLHFYKNKHGKMELSEILNNILENFKLILFRFCGDNCVTDKMSLLQICHIKFHTKYFRHKICFVAHESNNKPDVTASYRQTRWEEK